MTFLKSKNFSFNSENIIAVLMFIFFLILPTYTSVYKIQIYTNFFNTVLLCLSIVFIWGYCGTFSFGQAAFYGLGAYIYAIISGNMSNNSLTPLAAIIAIIVVWFFTLILGYFMFYGGVNDVFVGILTQCITLALSTFFGQTAAPKWHIGKIALGGYNGINQISPLYLGSLKLKGLPLYFASMFIVFISLLIFRIVEKTKFGYSMIAIRENRQRSSLFGYNVPAIQMIVFSIGGAIAAFAGVLYASWGGYVSPNSMSVTQATLPVILVASGGKKSPTAAVLFGFIYCFANNMLTGSGSSYTLLILGISLIIVVLFVPQGIFKSLFGFIDDKVSNAINSNSFARARRSN